MPLESATYIDQLVTSNPADTDNEGQGAAHLRLVKAVLQGQFPNLGNAAVTATAAQLNNAITSGNGLIPAGSMHWFPLDPGSTLMARGGTAAGTEQYVECDGSSYASSKFPNLASAFPALVSGGNIVMPNLNDTGRFVRARTSLVTAGTSQSNQNLSHNHTLTDPGHGHTLTDPGHNHAITDPGHTHTINFEPMNLATAGWGANGNDPRYIQAASPPYGSSWINSNTTGISINTHTTGVTLANNTTGITLAAQGGTEARPESYVAVCCLKT